MSIQYIQPQTNFPIARLVQDLGDGVTYYVQAVIRNAITDAIIAKVNLNLLGGRIWTNVWYAVQDSSGRGLYVTITTTVYTDTGYTVRSPNYYDESNTYVLYDQFHQLQGLATQISALLGAESNVDYKKIKKIFVEVLAAFEFNFPEIEQKDYGPQFKNVTETLKQAIASIEFPDMPEYSPTDLSPVIDHITGVEKGIHKRFDSLPEPKETDLSPVLERLDGVKFKDTVEQVEKALKIITQVHSRMENTMPHFGSYLDDITSQLKDFLYTLSKNSARSGKEEDLIESPKISMNGEARK